MAYYAVLMRTALTTEACLACERALLVLGLAHEQGGSWPASLEEAGQVTGLAVLLDPATGRPFSYSFDGRTATLRSDAAPRLHEAPLSASVTTK
jgi:hypothetical protein